MDLTYYIIAALILVLTRLLSEGSRDTSRVLGAEPPSRPAGVVAKVAAKTLAKSLAAVQPRAASRPGMPGRARATRKEVMRLVKAGRKAEAIKLLHQQTGLALDKAADLVGRLE